jgi:hypothetical protein
MKKELGYMVPLGGTPEMGPWICCQCGMDNEFMDVCDGCGHNRCKLCESEIDEDDIDFLDVIVET